MAESSPVDVSVVVITRNEERHIERCLESVMGGLRGLPRSEIVLVDSGSTDHTLLVAGGFPVRIVQIWNPRLASAAAGRYLGSRLARGRIIQFLDGDTILHPTWLQEAVATLDQHPEIAGIRGTVSQDPYPNPLAEMDTAAASSHNSEPGGETTQGIICGEVLLRREALDQAGNYNPFLVSEEEGELNARMLGIGARFWFLKIPMAVHVGHSEYRRGDIFRKMARYKRGYGQVLRLEWSRTAQLTRRVKILYEALRGFATAALEAAAVIALVAWHSAALLVVAIALNAVPFLFKVARRKSLRSALRFLRDLHIEWPFILRGFIRRPRPVRDFPVQVRVLKEG